MPRQPFLRAFVSPAALCALGLMAAMAAVFQFSLRAYVPGSLEPGGFTLANFAGLLKPLYGRVFFDTVWICFVTAACTLVIGYPVAYALVRAKSAVLKSAILIVVVTPLFLGEVVRTYSWIVVLGNNGFLNAPSSFPTSRSGSVSSSLPPKSARAAGSRSSSPAMWSWCCRSSCAASTSRCATSTSASSLPRRASAPRRGAC
jgi:ABC-type Fe3+ transport system permease subunit